MQPQLNVHHLELFYYVAKGGGITAALKLIPYGIQQPAVSLQMGQLEDAVGTRLFQRKPFALTPAGRQVYEFIAPFFSGLPNLAETVRGHAVQHLRLAASTNVMRGHFPKLLHQLKGKIEGLRVTLRDVALDAAVRLLHEHEVDLVLAVETPAAGNLPREKLLEVPMVLLVHRDTPFKTAAEVLRRAGEGGLPLIAPPEREVLTQRFQAEIRKTGAEWPVRIDAPGLDLIQTYVEEGFGVGLSLVIPGTKLSPLIRVLPLRNFPKLSYCAYWGERLTPVAEICLEQIRAIVAKL
jgi:DNA-binding transcriptional LysR family regulator